MFEGLRRNGKILFVVLVGGLFIGLGLGIVASEVYVLPRLTQKAILGFAVNPVQVSGTVSGARRGSLQFINQNETASTRYYHHVQLVDGNYSILLSGGYSYKVILGTGQTGATYMWSLYVPSNVTSLTVDFTS